MANMKDKSVENLLSAELLVTNNKLSSSIHCYYYSVLQISKYILNNFCHTDYTTQKAAAKRYEHGSHNYVISTTGENIRSKKGAKQCSDYYSQINKLKLYRERADYDSEKIGSNFVNKSKKECDSIHTLLKDIYEYEL